MTAAVVCLFATDMLVFDSNSSIISSPMISSMISGYGKVSEGSKRDKRPMTFQE
jgi:hypothetical protein